METLKELLGGILWINLNSRTDRRAEMENVLKELGLYEIAERFPAIPHGLGILGCGLSHIRCLELAKERGWKNVLIMEDDFQPVIPAKEFSLKLQEGLLTQEFTWDVLLLSYATQHPVLAAGPFHRTRDAQTASGYIVKSEYYDKLISTWKTAAQMLGKTSEHWHYALDQAWKPLQRADNFYMFCPRLGVQRPSFSNNTGKFESYRV